MENTHKIELKGSSILLTENGFHYHGYEDLLKGITKGLHAIDKFHYVTHIAIMEVVKVAEIALGNKVRQLSIKVEGFNFKHDSDLLQALKEKLTEKLNISGFEVVGGWVYMGCFALATIVFSPDNHDTEIKVNNYIAKTNSNNTFTDAERYSANDPNVRDVVYPIPVVNTIKSTRPVKTTAEGIVEKKKVEKILINKAKKTVKTVVAKASASHTVGDTDYPNYFNPVNIEKYSNLHSKDVKSHEKKFDSKASAIRIFVEAANRYNAKGVNTFNVKGFLHQIIFESGLQENGTCSNKGTLTNNFGGIKFHDFFIGFPGMLSIDDDKVNGVFVPSHFAAYKNIDEFVAAYGEFVNQKRYTIHGKYGNIKKYLDNKHYISYISILAKNGYCTDKHYLSGCLQAAKNDLNHI